MVQAFLKKWWVESDLRAPNLPLSLRLKVFGCHYNSIYNNTWTKQVKQLSKRYTMINISSNRSENKCQYHYLLITSQEVRNLQKSLNISYLCIFTGNMIAYMLKVFGCHYNSIYNNTWTKQVKQLSKQYQAQWNKLLWIISWYMETTNCDKKLPHKNRIEDISL
jgi:transketolase